MAVPVLDGADGGAGGVGVGPFAAQETTAKYAGESGAALSSPGGGAFVATSKLEDIRPDLAAMVVVVPDPQHIKATKKLSFFSFPPWLRLSF